MHITRQMWRFILQDVQIMIVLVLLAGIAIVLGSEAVQQLALVVAGTLCVLLLCMIVLYVVNTRKALKQRAAILAQAPVATWRLSAEEWAQFGGLAQVQRALDEQLVQWQPSLTRNAVVVSGAMFVMLGLLNLYEQDFVGVFGAFLVALGMFGLMLRSAYRIRHSLRYPFGMVAEPPDVIITAGGAVVGMQGIVFQQPRMTIQKAYVIPTEPSLLRIDLSYAMSKRRALPYTLMIPVAAGHEPEAEQAVAFLRRTFGAI